MTPRPPLPRSAWFLLGAAVEGLVFIAADVVCAVLLRKPVKPL